MEIRAAAIPDVLLIAPARRGDYREFPSEVYSRQALTAAGIDLEFVQDNHTLSAAAGTVRGLMWEDAALAIAWPEAAAKANLSDRDRRNPCLSDLADLF